MTDTALKANTGNPARPLLIWAGLTWDDVRGLQTDFGIVVRNGLIVSVGTRAALVSQYPDAQQVGSADYLLMPCFINAHDHGRGIGTGSFGIPDDRLEAWLPMLGLQPAISPGTAAAWDAINLLKSGVGFTAHSHNPRMWENQTAEIEATISGYSQFGMGAAVQPVIVDQNALVYSRRNEFMASLPTDLTALAKQWMAVPSISLDSYLLDLDTLITRFHLHDGIEIQISPACAQWCSDALIVACTDYAATHHIRLQMHLDETSAQERYARQTFGRNFLAHLEELNVLSRADWTFAHAVHLDADDPARLARYELSVATNPGSNLRLRSGTIDLQALRAQGVCIGVGMDGHSLDDDQDYWRELRLLWAQSGVTASDVLRMGLSDSAHATTQYAVGKLEIGAAASVQLLDWPSVRGAYDPDDAALIPNILLRRASRDHVRQVFTFGVQRVFDGKVPGEDAIFETLREEVNRANGDHGKGASTRAKQWDQATRLATQVRKWMYK